VRSTRLSKSFQWKKLLTLAGFCSKRGVNQLKRRGRFHLKKHTSWALRGNFHVNSFRTTNLRLAQSINILQYQQGLREPPPSLCRPLHEIQPSRLVRVCLLLKWHSGGPERFMGRVCAGLYNCIPPPIKISSDQAKSDSRAGAIKMAVFGICWQLISDNTVLFLCQWTACEVWLLQLSLASCAYVVCHEKIKSRVTNVNKMCMRAAAALLATGHISTLCVRAKANVRQNNLFSGRKMGFQEHAAALRGLLFSHPCTMGLGILKLAVHHLPKQSYTLWMCAVSTIVGNTSLIFQIIKLNIM
jgi:hypothetical protein